MKIKELKITSESFEKTPIVLLYFYMKADGQWEKFKKILEEKEEISSFSAAAEELQTWIDRIVKDKPDTEFVAITQKEYPAYLKTAYHPPFVLLYQGDIDILQKKYKFLAAEDACVSNMLKKYGISHVTKGKNEVSLYYNSVDGEKELSFQETSEDLRIKRVVDLADRVLAVDGAADFLSALAAEGKDKNKKKLYALPGNAGCMCNKLIKQGWHLCDSGMDLIDLPPEAKTSTEETKESK